MKYDTEYIDQYLNGELSESAVKALEEKMETDEDFAYEVELYQMAIQVVQYPNFMKEMKEIRREIALEDENAMLHQPSEKGDVSKASAQKEREIPIVEPKPKRSFMVRRLLAIAASLLLIILVYYTVPMLQQASSPMADITNTIIGFESGDKGGVTAASPLQQGIQLFEDGNYQAAIPFFDRVIQENIGKRTDAQFLKADALHHLGRKNEVRAVLQSIREEDNERHYKEAKKILEKYK